MPERSHELVAIVDFGAQYGHLIARRVRELGVYCEIFPAEKALLALADRHPQAVILTGGPSSVYAAQAPTLPQRFLEQWDVPVLGICYGMQLMAYLLGGKVERAQRREYGHSQVDITAPSPLWKDVPPTWACWMSHGDVVLRPPKGFTVLAATENAPVAAMGHAEKRWFGVQFHPEVKHTEGGQTILANFLFNIAGLKGDWTTESFVEEQVERIRWQVGEGRAICGLSGGVDSVVAARLVHRAIGDRLQCIFVDHGLLREGESEQVMLSCREQLGLKVERIEAQDEFIDALAGVTDPEEKRRRIGEKFIRIFERQGRCHEDAAFLVQGTIYPDVIESGTENAAVIKTHHNVGGLPADMNFELVEPLRDLFKDEVRRVGLELGLAPEMVDRHPFPGPGLAVRVMGEVTPEKLAILRRADAIFIDEIRRAGLYHEIWQAFAALPSFRSVGVMGDQRTYAYPIVLRAVCSDDAMTADWYRFTPDMLARISTRIVNEVEEVNRVVYDITTKPPSTIEWE